LAGAVKPKYAFWETKIALKEKYVPLWALLPALKSREAAERYLAKSS
jgi:hypothetical protein